MTPADTLLAIADRFDALDPAVVLKADGFTFSTAPRALRIFAGKIESPDPAQVALAVQQIRKIGAAWVGGTTWYAPAALWGEAVAAVAELAPGVAPAASPAAPFLAMLSDAYARGKAAGVEEERERQKAWAVVIDAHCAIYKNSDATTLRMARDGHPNARDYIAEQVDDLTGCPCGDDVPCPGVETPERIAYRAALIALLALFDKASS